MENIKSSSVKAHSAENMGSCDDVQSIDGIIQKLLNDTDIKSKKNTKIETFDNNKDEKKGDKGTEQTDQIAASVILAGEPLLSSLSAKLVQQLQTNNAGNKSVSNVPTRISTVNVSQHAGVDVGRLKEEILIHSGSATIFTAADPQHQENTQKTDKKKYESSEVTVLSAMPVPDKVIDDSGWVTEKLSSGERGKETVNQQQLMSAKNVTPEVNAKSNVTEVSWTFPTQQTAQVRIEHAQNKSDTQIQIVPSNIETEQQLVNFQQQHPLHGLRVDNAVPTVNDYLQNQQNSQQQNEANQDVLNDEEEEM
ncbi:hypothetical protein FDX19_03470 [Citrobacter sp. wls619]|uniref:hypothetical protein n=1 Tax=Citrobacter sp. wls619 TaxID=2576432 RepID=UPI0010C95066|nr:hypothetical protein [Citrobacter sp. wls619]TKV12634.1 hypothetical protein FDX19_03470 [Citrobacter sp. wls619]